MVRASPASVSAGVLAWRGRPGGPEFLLVHPGGPYWRKKDEGVWSIPKGLIDPGEEPLAAAIREFGEETGLIVSDDFAELTPLRQKGGKTVRCWLTEADLDLAAFRSNDFEMLWPPGSGQLASFPECDRADYFGAATALQKILPGQGGFIREALERLSADLNREQRPDE